MACSNFFWTVIITMGNWEEGTFVGDNQRVMLCGIKKRNERVSVMFFKQFFTDISTLTNYEN